MPGPPPAIPEYRSLTPEALDALERAVREQRRVALRRRGTEYVVGAERLETSGRDDVLAGGAPPTRGRAPFLAPRPGDLPGVSPGPPPHPVPPPARGLVRRPHTRR